jgi:hypothetical protein
LQIVEGEAISKLAGQALPENEDVCCRVLFLNERRSRTLSAVLSVFHIFITMDLTIEHVERCEAESCCEPCGRVLQY